METRNAASDTLNSRGLGSSEMTGTAQINKYRGDRARERRRQQRIQNGFQKDRHAEKDKFLRLRGIRKGQWNFMHTIFSF